MCITIKKQGQMENKNNPQQFEYMMLSRLQSDCEYFLGYGGGSERNLYSDNVREHIGKMKSLWNKLEVKPEWISITEIEEYEKRMINYK